MLLTGQSKWYVGSTLDSSSNPAHEAFEKAKEVFGHLQKSPTSAQGFTGMQDVMTIVNEAKQKYETRLDHGARKWLARFSWKVMFYSNILDMFVQHHPEYAALAWGAMKILFVMSINHEKTIKTLAKAFSQIAEALPQAELAAILYPTGEMISAVSELYAHILSFCIRAKRWYQESRWMHAVDSLIRPMELRYLDLIKDIESQSQTVQLLAQAAARAEQRDMHILLEKLLEMQRQSNTQLAELQSIVKQFQGTITNAQLDTNSKLDDLQLSEIMGFLSGHCQIDEVKYLQACALARHQRSLRCENKDIVLWRLPRFDAWSRFRGSSVLVISGDRITMLRLRDFCADTVQMFRDTRTPVLFGLNPGKNGVPAGHTNVDILSSLVLQALRQNIHMNSDKSLTLACGQFRRAETENDWIDLLGMTLFNFPLVYIVVDLDLLCPPTTSTLAGLTWLSMFQRLFDELHNHGAKSVVKVVMINRGSLHSTESERNAPTNFFISMPRTGRNTTGRMRDMPIIVGKGRNKYSSRWQQSELRLKMQQVRVQDG